MCLCKALIKGWLGLTENFPAETPGTPICHACGTIFDMSRQLLPLPTPPPHLPNDLTVTGLRVEYDVICASCREALGEERCPALASTTHRASSRHHTR